MKKVTEDEFKSFVYDRSKKLISIGATHMSQPPVSLYKDREGVLKAKILHWEYENGQPTDFYVLEENK